MDGATLSGNLRPCASTHRVEPADINRQARSRSVERERTPRKSMSSNRKPRGVTCDSEGFASQQRRRFVLAIAIVRRALVPRDNHVRAKCADYRYDVGENCLPRPMRERLLRGSRVAEV